MIASDAAIGVSTAVLSGVPSSARDLIWRTFFIDAGRGIDFAAHLPWHGDAAVRTVELSSKAGNAVAAAVIRPARQPEVAMVGYVCVDASMRGQGLGRVLIGAVNATIDALGYRAALLWTSKPDVYAGQGYAVLTQDIFVNVKQRPTDRVQGSMVARSWPDARDGKGLPAFARRGWHLSSGMAAAIVVEGARGATLIDWQGDANEVAALVAAGGYARWSVNLPADGAFERTLRAQGHGIRIEPGATTMVRCGDPSFVPDFVPVADRI